MIISIVATYESFSCDKIIIDGLNKLPGNISPDISRVVTTQRVNYKERVESRGLTYHDEPALYYSECEE